MTDPRRQQERQAIAMITGIVGQIDSGKACLIDMTTHRAAIPQKPKPGDSYISYAPSDEMTLTLRIGPPGRDQEVEDPPTQRRDNRTGTLHRMTSARASAGVAAHPQHTATIGHLAANPGEEPPMSPAPFQIVDQAQTRDIVLQPVPNTNPQQYLEVEFEGQTPNTPNRLRLFIEKGGDPDIRYMMGQIRRTMTKTADTVSQAETPPAAEESAE